MGGNDLDLSVGGASVCCLHERLKQGDQTLNHKSPPTSDIDLAIFTRFFILLILFPTFRMFSGDFTLAKDEDFGDYYCDLSEKSNRILRATVKTYEHTGTYVFLKLFKKKPDAEFALVQKITLTKEEFEILLWKGKSVLQPPNIKKVTKKCKKIRNPHLLILWRRRMTGTT